MLYTYRPEIDKLLKNVITDLNYRGITTHFSCTDYVQGTNVKSNGYFDAESREFACAIGKPLHLWLRTFVHESCHFDQWKENCDAWKNFEKLDKDEDLLWDWIDGKFDLNKSGNLFEDVKRLKHVVEVTREIELDCERRSINKIEEYKLPIAIGDYAQSAWAYITFYDYILESRKWYIIGKEPYNNEELKELMPSTLYPEFEDNILTDEMRKFYKTCVE